MEFDMITLDSQLITVDYTLPMGKIKFDIQSI